MLERDLARDAGLLPRICDVGMNRVDRFDQVIRKFDRQCVDIFLQLHNVGRPDDR